MQLYTWKNKPSLSRIHRKHPKDYYTVEVKITYIMVPKRLLHLNNSALHLAANYVFTLGNNITHVLITPLLRTVYFLRERLLIPTCLDVEPLLPLRYIWYV